MLRDAPKERQRELVALAIARARPQGQKIVTLDLPTQSTEAMACGNHPGRATHADIARRLVTLLHDELGW